MRRSTRRLSSARPSSQRFTLSRSDGDEALAVNNPAISTSRVVQVFPTTSSLAPHLQERVRARERSVANTGHALPPPEHLTPKDPADVSPGSPGPSDALKALAKRRAAG